MTNQTVITLTAYASDDPIAAAQMMYDQQIKIIRLRAALMWTFDRAELDGGMTEGECQHTAEEIGKVLTGKPSIATRYVSKEWDASAKLSVSAPQPESSEND